MARADRRRDERERVTLLTAARTLGRVLDYDVLLVSAFLGPEPPVVLYSDRNPDRRDLSH